MVVRGHKDHRDQLETKEREGIRGLLERLDTQEGKGMPVLMDILVMLYVKKQLYACCFLPSGVADRDTWH